MRKRLLTLSLVIAAALGVFRGELARAFLQYGLNQATDDLFARTIQISKVHLDWKGRVRIESLKARLRAASGPIPLEVRSISSKNSFLRAFSDRGLALNFEGVHLQDSQREGVSGEARIRMGREERFELQADILSLGLEEIRWISPEHLAGSSGEIQGKVTLQSKASGAILLEVQLRVREPGGRISARFFDLLLPYLPQIGSSERVAEIRAAGGLVGFHDASLALSWKDSDRIKIFLHILVPDYNLDLNVNTEIRMDEKNSFSELAEIFGLINQKG